MTDLEIHENSGVLASDLRARRVVTTFMTTTGVDPDLVTSAPNLLLAPPAPNPAVGLARLRYAAHSSGPVTLEVYDAQGRLVEHVADLDVGDEVGKRSGRPRT
ncbi:MAG: hypothetical protein R3E12_04540 [Candidatus Eisenbacteria bacterium]